MRDWDEVLLTDEHGLVAVAVVEGNVVGANRAAAALFRRDVVGIRARELFDPASWPKLEPLLSSGGGCELQIVDGAGTLRAVRFAALVGGDGQTLLVAPCSTSVSYSEDQGRELIRLNEELGLLTRELSRRARELGRAHAQLERLDAMRQQFMAMLAHDLKQPLAAVRLVGRGLSRKPEAQSAEQIRTMGLRLDRAAVRMTSLIDTVLVAARLESGDIALSTRPTSVDALVRETTEALAPLAGERGITFACETTGDATASVDPTWIEQVLSNLLGNAIRYAPEGSTVRVSLAGENAWVRCEVVDRGPGVPPELREAIFERFHQGGARPGSAGLGLYVARQLVQLHGGRIWAEAADEGGARFCFELPKRADRSQQPLPARSS
jgi:signal transduction histidine kinase